MLAEAVFARQYEVQPELRERYGERGQAKCVVGTEDVERNLVCLRDVLSERLPDDMRETAIGCVEESLKTLPEATSAPVSFLDGDDDLIPAPWRPSWWPLRQRE